MKKILLTALLGFGLMIPTVVQCANEGKLKFISIVCGVAAAGCAYKAFDLFRWNMNRVHHPYDSHPFYDALKTLGLMTGAVGFGAYAYSLVKK